MTPSLNPHHHPRRRPFGFTLMELLVVIGIIAVLLSIVFPVVSKMRKAAYAASSAQSINTLQAAIQQYFVTFQANPDLTFGTINPGIAYTTSEALVLALQGGLNVTFTTTASPSIATITYNAQDIGRGTVSFNPLNPKRYAPFGATLKYSEGKLPGAETDSVIPEFLDAYPEALPILYLRADQRLPDRYSATAFDPYNVTFPSPDGTDSDNLPDFNTFGDYLKDPSSNPVTVRNRDSYILISAGPDRKFGTKDDVTNFGTPGE